MSVRTLNVQYSTAGRERSEEGSLHKMSNEKAARACRRLLLAQKSETDCDLSVLDHCHASPTNVVNTSLSRP